MSTKAGVDAVYKCGPNVRGTITAHHLWGTNEDAEKDVFNLCKPIMKTSHDRLALIRAIVDGSGKFFFGTDSAPHPIESKVEKEKGCAAAGCFTQPQVLLLECTNYIWHSPHPFLLLQKNQHTPSFVCEWSSSFSR